MFEKHTSTLLNTNYILEKKLSNFFSLNKKDILAYFYGGNIKNIIEIFNVLTFTIDCF